MWIRCATRRREKLGENGRYKEVDVIAVEQNFIGTVICMLLEAVTMCMQFVSSRDSTEEEDDEEVMLFWNEGKTQKSVRDLVLDRRPEDQEILSYYRYTVALNNKCFQLVIVVLEVSV